MLCSIKNLAERRFVTRCWISGGLVVLFSIFAAVVFRLWHLHGALAYLVAVLPALPILWVLVATGTFLAEEKDEFQRNLLVQSLLGGTGAILAGITVWAYLEDFARAPHLDLVWVYPIFWLFVGISYYVVKARYR
jgi:hypothetical protein